MNRKALLAIIVVGLAFAMGFTIAARMTTTGGEVIDRDVLAGGGDRSTAPSGYVLTGTIGQPVAGISTASNGTTLVHGFHVMAQRGPTSARRWELY